MNKVGSASAMLQYPDELETSLSFNKSTRTELEPLTQRYLTLSGEMLCSLWDSPDMISECIYVHPDCVNPEGFQKKKSRVFQCRTRRFQWILGIRCLDWQRSFCFTMENLWIRYIPLDMEWDNPTLHKEVSERQNLFSVYELYDQKYY